MRAMSAKRRKSTVAMRDLRVALNERCQGECERCGFPLHVQDDGPYLFDAHHRKQRSVGGKDTLSNLTAIHAGCHTVHRKSVHEDVDEATASGWLVPSWGDPSVTAIVYKGEVVLLDDFGGILTQEVPF